MAEEVIQGGEHLKPETVEVLKELESEGHSIEGITPKEEPKEPAKAEPVKTEEPKTEKPESEPEEAETKPEGSKRPERKVQAVPVHKYNEERHKRQEAEGKIAELEQQLAGLSRKPETAADVKALMEQLGNLDNEEAKLAAIVDFTRKGVNTQLPPEVAEKLKVLDKYEKLSVEAEEAKMFEADFEKVAKDLADTGVDVSAHKDKIKQLAYTEGYTSTSLRAIALEYAHDNGLFQKGRKTLEKGSAGRTASTEVIDFESMTDEQAKALPDDQWEKYVEFQIAKQQRSQGIVKATMK